MNDSASAVPSSDRRCFLALIPDPAGVRTLLHCREILQHSVVSSPRGVRWLEPASLHMTLRFLGKSTQAQITYLEHMLPTLAAMMPTFATHRFGIWPNRARPRLLVLELDAARVLSELVDRCGKYARNTGFAPEARGFRSHITLARLRPGCVFGNLPKPPSAIAFDAIALMQSTLAQPAAVYRELARTNLGR